MKLASVVILCLVFPKTYSLCVEIYTTVCDNLLDVKTYGNKNWLSLTVGNMHNERIPNETLETDVFNNCTNLEELTIIGTVNKVDSRTLMPLQKLLVLNFYKNSIKILSDFTFVVVPQLAKLDLQNNNIEQFISEGPFINSDLETVNLSYNKLRRLSIDTFKIAGLRKLTITHNKISEIAPTNIFSTDLNYLNMDNNYLNHIPEEVFKDMDKLEELILSNNQFTILRIKYQLKGLKKLDLSHNSISIVDAEFFDGMPNLKDLYLNHNVIKQLPLTIFQTNFNKLQIRTLHLHNNRIENLQFLVKNQWAALKELTISQNPWPCDCLNSFLTFMKLGGLELTYCEKLYFASGKFPVCIEVESYWSKGECLKREEPGDIYNIFLNIPKEHYC